MPVTAAVMGGITAVGSITGSALQSSGANSAEAAQEQAATSVTNQANAAATAAEGAVNTATGTANTTIGNSLQGQIAALAPYIQSGQLSLSQVQQMLGPNGPLAGAQNQFSFNPTTSPQLQFEQQQANQGLMRNAAATGTALSGGTIRASDALNTGLASTYMNQAFNQQLAQYNTNRQNVLTRLQGLTGLTGLGFNATGAESQDIGTAGTEQARNTLGAGMYTGQTGLAAANIAENATIAAANAKSANNLAQGNIWGGLSTSLGNTAAQYFGMAQGINGSPNGSGPPITSPTFGGVPMSGISTGSTGGSSGISTGSTGGSSGLSDIWDALS